MKKVLQHFSIIFGITNICSAYPFIRRKYRKTAELSIDEQALKSIEEHAKQHRHDEENDLEISGEYLLHLSTKLPLYDSNDLKPKQILKLLNQ